MILTSAAETYDTLRGTLYEWLKFVMGGARDPSSVQGFFFRYTNFNGSVKRSMTVKLILYMYVYIFKN
jgi:hypothetical protein